MSKLTDQLERRIKAAIADNTITITNHDVAGDNGILVTTEDLSASPHCEPKSKRGGKRPGAGRYPKGSKIGRIVPETAMLAYRVNKERKDEIDAAIKAFLKKRFKITVRSNKKHD